VRIVPFAEGGFGAYYGAMGFEQQLNNRSSAEKAGAGLPTINEKPKDPKDSPEALRLQGIGVALEAMARNEDIPANVVAAKMVPHLTELGGDFEKFAHGIVYMALQARRADAHQ
jgi:hypothetical protein